ncbi:ArsR family transcriptional regulator [Alteromonas sediminis]|uniref:ArsR family transcriptional regulator n=1 Tax=Alteromonas sediminis TaxID=2259342 RepID=A0A3N5Y601_9ALTE|nr:metalloregulator ArsR/SmtB family transcription factor [Alteromonas sediminis]RPJ68703.1 ArsR family transcriptional regulator [Alteromonas sediminis]
MLSPLTFYKCLAEETRLKSVLLICKYDALCVCDLQVALGMTQPKVSRHLAELRKCGLLSDERRGKWVYYRLHDKLPDWARDVLHITVSKQSDYLAGSVQLLSLSKTQCCES